MTKELAIVDLLLKLYPTVKDFQRFLYSLSAGKDLLKQINFSGSLGDIAFEVVDQLRTRGLIDAGLFERLHEEWPGNEDIQGVRDKWLIDINSWNQLPSDQLKSKKNKETPTVFVSYARRDSSFFEELNTHLKILEHKNVIDIWHEGRIRAGERWEQIISSQIEQADIIVLLVSPDLLSSEFIWQHEFQKALERYHQQKAIIIPIIIRECAWRESPIGSIQVLPKDGRPVSKATNTDRAWMEVSSQIMTVAKNWREYK